MKRPVQQVSPRHVAKVVRWLNANAHLMPLMDCGHMGARQYRAVVGEDGRRTQVAFRRCGWCGRVEG